MDSPCPKCKGSKHVQDKTGQWIRCDCLAAEALQRKLLEAGVTVRQADLTLNKLEQRYPYPPLDMEIIEYLKGIFKLLAQGKKPSLLGCYTGAAIGAKDVVFQSLVKELLETTELTVKIHTLQDLISAYFQDEQRFNLLDSFRQTNIFLLDFGSELQFNIGNSFIKDLLRAHWSGTSNLILTTTLSFGGICSKYEEAKDLFVPFEQRFKNDRRAVCMRLEKGN